MLRVITLQFVINRDKSLSYNGVHIQSSVLFMRSIKSVGLKSKLAPGYNNLFEITKKETSVLTIGSRWKLVEGTESY
jgi:hypothetical protein